jgi:hypothetical protein
MLPKFAECLHRADMIHDHDELPSLSISYNPRSLRLWRGARMLAALMFNLVSRDLAIAPAKDATRSTSRKLRRNAASALHYLRDLSHRPLSVWWCAHILDVSEMVLRQHGLPVVNADSHPGQRIYAAGLADWRRLRDARQPYRPVRTIEMREAVTRTCPQCSQPFETTAHRGKEHCSNRCYRASMRKRPTRTVYCPECRKEFETRHARQKYCSWDCSRLGSARYQRGRHSYHPENAPENAQNCDMGAIRTPGDPAPSPAA